MRVVLISEGNTDITLSSFEPTQGAVKQLLRRLLGEFLGRELHAKEIVGARLPKLHQGGGYRRKVVAACDIHQDKYEAIAIVVDRDGSDERRRLLEQGREDAQVQGHAIALRLAIGVAKEMQEAWLLADTAALGDVFGASGAQPDPESLPNPKVALTKLISQTELSINKGYDQAAQAADLQVIRDRCGSFEQFSSEVKRHIAQPGA